MRLIASVLALALLAAALPAADAPVAQPAPAARILDAYGSVPGGVALESVARGFDEIKTIEYNKEKNQFVINGGATYTLPVMGRKEFAKVYKAFLGDKTKFGAEQAHKRYQYALSLINGSSRTFGPVEGDASRNLADSDKLLGGIIYGFEELIGDTRLPGGYKPKKAAKRAVEVIAFTEFTNFVFEKKGNEYVFKDCLLNVNMLPLAKEKLANGGHMYDEERMKNFVLEDADRDNIAHLRSFQTEYFKMDPFATTIKFGQVAAFARLLCESSIDHEALLKQLR